MMVNLPTIVEEVNQYVNSYIAHKDGSSLLHPRDFERKYKYSTLPYFDSILLGGSAVGNSSRQ